MHEYGITESVAAAQVAGKLPGATVTHVHLGIGPVSGVSADSVRFYSGRSMVSAGSAARSRAAATTAWPKLIPPSLAGTR